MKKYDLKFGGTYSNKSGSSYRTIVSINPNDVIYIQHGKIRKEHQHYCEYSGYEKCFKILLSSFAGWAFKKVDLPEDEHTSFIEAVIEKNYESYKNCVFICGNTNFID